MEPKALDAAAAELAKLQKRRWPLDRLSEGDRITTLQDAHAVQDAVVALLGETVAGYKISVTPDGKVMRGAILGSRIWRSPARVAAASVPLLGVEAEIAFRLEKDLPPREAIYGREEIEQAVTALAAIEVVDSRFRSYKDAPSLDRTADFMSNGGFVEGEPCADWRVSDLASIGVELLVDGKSLVSHKGGHGSGHPIIPAVALINELRATIGLRAGQILTTGTYTGLNHVRPGATVTVAFAGFTKVEVTFER